MHPSQYFSLLLSLFLLLGCNTSRVAQVKDEPADTNMPTAQGVPADIVAFREELNKSYLDPKTSILSEAQRMKLKMLKGHPFFPYDADYSLEADFEVFENPEVLTMPTAAGTEKTFNIYAQLSFEIKGEKRQLFVYQNHQSMNNPLYADYLFLPFRDATSGKETYGGGRYLEMRIPPEGSKTVSLDFNKAYQPYCAYTTGYFCPIPPAENTLDIPIKAGVMHVDLWMEE